MFLHKQELFKVRFGNPCRSDSQMCKSCKQSHLAHRHGNFFSTNRESQISILNLSTTLSRRSKLEALNFALISMNLWSLKINFVFVYRHETLKILIKIFVKWAMEDETLKRWRDFAVYNFIPKALVFGVLSNLVNYVILSRSVADCRTTSLAISASIPRPCIKSTTNIYLSILAFTDTSFLLLIYVFSKQYHDDVHHPSHEIYWRTLGLVYWFFTAFCKKSPDMHMHAALYEISFWLLSVYITVYVTLSLALDRYAIVRRPATTRCGIARAKNVISSKFHSLAIYWGFRRSQPGTSSSCYIPTQHPAAWECCELNF